MRRMARKAARTGDGEMVAWATARRLSYRDSNNARVFSFAMTDPHRSSSDSSDSHQPPHPKLVFRRQASARRSLSVEGDPLRLSPGWLNWAFYLLAGVLLAVAVFVLVAKTPHYARGPAVVRAEDPAEVTAPEGGRVTAIAVEVGDRVRAGQRLLALDQDRELKEFRRIAAAFDRQLVNRLREPADPAAAELLAGLRLQREAALDRLRSRVLVAPSAGWVRNLRVRPGQNLSPGDLVLSLSSRREAAEVVAFLPAEYRPLLRRGLPMRLRVSTAAFGERTLVLSGVEQDILGPAEARRILGRTYSESINLSGPVVVAYARIEGARAPTDSALLYDGMVGVAEVLVRRERLIVALFPKLKRNPPL